MQIYTKIFVKLNFFILALTIVSYGFGANAAEFSHITNEERRNAHQDVSLKYANIDDVLSEFIRLIRYKSKRAFLEGWSESFGGRKYIRANCTDMGNFELDYKNNYMTFFGCDIEFYKSNRSSIRLSRGSNQSVTTEIFPFSDLYILQDSGVGYFLEFDRPENQTVGVLKVRPSLIFQRDKTAALNAYGLIERLQNEFYE